MMEQKLESYLVSNEWILGALLRISKLSPQQLVVLRCLAAGMDNRSIAAIMGRSERTIKAHVGALIERLHVDSRLQLGLIGYHALLLANPHLLSDADAHVPPVPAHRIPAQRSVHALAVGRQSVGEERE
jgi:DNA-binding CsgD family transcriptional regulator